MEDITSYTLLLRVANNGEEEAWSELLRIYTPLVYGLARRCGLQDADAADVVQEVFSNVARSISCFQCDRNFGSFRGWLLAVTRSRLGDFHRACTRRCRGSGDTGVYEQLKEMPAEDDCQRIWEEEYERSVYRWAADQVKPQFAESTWAAFWQTSVKNRPVSEVAETLGISRGAVYIARSRVLAKLKEKVREVEGQ